MTLKICQWEVTTKPDLCSYHRFPVLGYTTVLFEENAYDFFFSGGGGGGANKVYYGRYANCELHLKVLNYNTV